MSKEILDYLEIVEMKLVNLLQDIRNIRTQLDTLNALRRHVSQASPLTRANQGIAPGQGASFFAALQAEDFSNQAPRNNG